MKKGLAGNYMFLTFSMICWGLSFVWYRQALVHFKPLSIVFARLIISAPLLYLTGTLLSRLRKVRRADLSIFLLLAFFEPFLYFLPFVLISDFEHIVTQKWSFSMFLPVINLAIFGSIIAYLGFIEGLRNLGVSKATAFTNFIPAFTAISAFVLLDEVMKWFKISGILLVIAGLIMSQAVKPVKKGKPKNNVKNELY